MKEIYFIAIENSNVGQTTYCKYAFESISTAKQALKECVEDYMETLDIDDLQEEWSDETFYATDNCGTYIYITIQKVELVKK